MLLLRIVAAASMFQGGVVNVVLARKDDGNLRRSRAQGSEFYFTPSSASLPDEENTSSSSSVKIRTTSDAPFRVFTRQAPSNTIKRRRRDKRNNTIPPLNTNTIPMNDAQQLLPQCPSPYDIQRTEYVAGDSVEVYDTIFTCQPTPYEEYCNIPTLDEAYNNNIGISTNGDGQQMTVKSDEEVKNLWLNAWIENGQCEHYTSSPSNDPTITNVPTTSNVPTYTPSMSSFPSFSSMPTKIPTYSPTTSYPTYSPSSSYPTYSPSTASPTYVPTASFNPTGMPSFYPSDVPSASPSRSPLAVSPDAYNNNNQQLNQNNFLSYCNDSNQIHLRIEIQTDNYPTDTSWQFIDRTSNVILLSSPISGYTGETLGNGRMVAQYDVRDICLDNSNDLVDTTEGEKVVQLTTKNTYEFALYDKYGDGLCCRIEDVSGYYKVMQKKKQEELDNNDDGDDDENSWKVLVAASNFNAKEVHHYFELSTTTATIPSLEQSLIDSTIIDTEPNATNITTTKTTADTSIQLICPYPQRKITIKLQTDVNGEEVSWEFRVKNGPTLARNDRTYVNDVIQTDTRDVCINDASLYELIINDEYGDGLARAVKRNNDEQDGYYKIMTHHRMSDDSIESDDTTGETILHGGYFRSKKITHLINTTLPTLSDRDSKWLHEHNTRRKYWHTHYNTTYIPLQWSESLKDEAQVWADHLLDYCGSRMYHDPDRIYGENAAGNVGRDHWGERRDPEQILARFVEFEVDWDWPDNGHLTQTVSV